MRRWSYGFAVKYFDITGVFDIPETFLFSPELPASVRPEGLPAPVLQRVTRRIQGRITFATVAQLDANLYYHFAPGKTIDPYIKANLGVGRGWLGRWGEGPFVEEAHVGIAPGLRWNQGRAWFVYAESSFQYYVARTGASSFLDRTEVLVNPRRGNVYVLRGSAGFGLYF